ncbi:MAG: hypothetical protein ACREL3_06885 [Gemmatimonadales bacterium]
MHDPAIHTAEDATPQELRRASLRLLGMLVLLGLLVVPFLMLFPGGETTRIGLLAWLLVILALYWLYAGLGYQPVLLIQLMAFSAAASLLTTKAALLLVGIAQVGVLRWSARVLIVLGALLAVGNLGSMLLALRRRRRLEPHVR